MKSSSDAQVDCRACTAGLPLVWHVQSRKMMHLAQGLSVTSCARIDADEAELMRLRVENADLRSKNAVFRRSEERERRARDIANDRGNEDGRGR